MSLRIHGLTGATLVQAPSVCHECVWWQSRTAGRTIDKERWIQKTETEFGAWGSLYLDDDGKVLGSMQFGAARLFPRSLELPAGPPSDDAVLVTGLDTVTGVRDGTPTSAVGRVTFVVAKRGADWQIVHFHRSAMPQ